MIFIAIMVNNNTKNRFFDVLFSVIGIGCRASKKKYKNERGSMPETTWII